MTQAWWRFSEYELRDGYLRPAPGAALERYRPWDLYRDSREKAERGQQPPYQELTALLNNFRAALDSQGTFVPTKSAVDALLGWCGRYGLLGLLPHQVKMVTFRPRAVWTTPREADGPEPTWEIHSFVRETAEWHSTSGFSSPSDRWTDEDMGLEPTELPTFPQCDSAPPGLPPRDWPKPRVLTGDLRHGRLDSQSLEEGWFPYFPGSEPSQPTPLPLTPEFWRVYAEPLDSFFRAAAILRRAMEWYTNPVKKHNAFVEPYPKVPTEFRGLGLSPKDDFDRLLQSVSPTMLTTSKGEERKYRDAWLAPSLLGMFAMMCRTDLVERRLAACVACETVFVSGGRAADYCTPTCRSLIIMRRHRAKVTEARKLQSQGKSATAIAKRLGSKVETVKGWIKKAPATKRKATRKKTARKSR